MNAEARRVRQRRTIIPIYGKPHVLTFALTSLSSVPDGIHTLPALGIAAMVVFVAFKVNKRFRLHPPQRKS